MGIGLNKYSCPDIDSMLCGCCCCLCFLFDLHKKAGVVQETILTMMGT